MCETEAASPRLVWRHAGAGHGAACGGPGKVVPGHRIHLHNLTTFINLVSSSLFYHHLGLG